MTFRPSRFRKRRQRMLLLSAVVGLVLLAGIGSSVNQDARDRLSVDSLRYEMQWRGDRLWNLLDANRRQEYGWLAGLGFGSGSDQYYGLDSVTSGVLGGDVAIAYGLGGVYGLVVLGSLWAILFTLRRRVRVENGSNSIAAMDTYLALIGGMSLLTPMLMQLILTTSTISGLIVGFLVLADAGRMTAVNVHPPITREPRNLV